jgi:hypothetical protein
MIFGFTRMKLFDRIEGGGKFTLPLFLRASLMQSNEIKFLIRYEIESKTSDYWTSTNADKMSRFRFCRMALNMDSLYAFAPKKHVHLSSKKANEHIFNV